MRNLFIVALLTALSSAGCASYTTPGGPARLAQIGGEEPVEAERQPSPQFPMHLVVARIQAAKYRSYTAAGLGQGHFSVIAAPDRPDGAERQAMANWPQLSGVAMLDPALLPPKLETADDLRLAAAKMQADLLLIYTVATVFQVDGHSAAPAADLPLRRKPHSDAQVRSTASLAFVDVRTGFVYGRAETGATLPGVAEVWTSAEALDAKRQEAERQALDALWPEAQRAWTNIVASYQ